MTKEQHNVLIIGEHPVLPDILKQFVSLNCRIVQNRLFNEESFNEEWDDIFIALNEDVTPMENDAKAIRIVEAIYALLVKHSISRPVIHLLLQSHATMALLQSREYKDEWHSVFELNAFTMDDVWAKNVVCMSSSQQELRGLDYHAVTMESDRTVHLVILGVSNLASALAENSALVAHYPNYTRDHTLRTRITIIDKDIKEWSKVFISQHKALMDNSYYRTIDIQQRKSELHKPMYEGKREDFVDVEWEFVNGTVHDIVVQDKLIGWADDEDKVLSIALCHDDDAINLSETTLIADMLCEREIPIYVKQSTSAMKNIISQSPRMKNVVMVGMQDCGYDISLPLLKMAKRVNSVYEYCYDNNIASEMEGCSSGSNSSSGLSGLNVTAPSYIDDDAADANWLNVKKAIKRYSNICNAMTLATKMRSLGHQTDERDTFYAITQQEIDIIAEVEHNRWSVEELLLGFRPCTDEEQADIEADISKKDEYKNRLVHYDLRAYNDLRADSTGKNVNTYDICLSASIPLIAYEGESASSSSSGSNDASGSKGSKGSKEKGGNA